jgi:peptidylprolyl isomerase
MRRFPTLALVFMLALAGCSGSTGGQDTGSTTVPVATVAQSTEGATSQPAPGAGTTGEGARDGDTVSVNYIGTLDDGTQFDSSYDREPLQFEVGSDQVIKGFDDAVHGMVVGEKKTVRIPPEDAYGPVDDSLIFQVPIEQIPAGVTVGDQLLIDGVVYGRVTAMSDSEATIDTNHEYAGQALTFEIEMVSIN